MRSRISKDEILKIRNVTMVELVDLPIKILYAQYENAKQNELLGLIKIKNPAKAKQNELLGLIKIKNPAIQKSVNMM